MSKKTKSPARALRGAASYRRGWWAEWLALIFLLAKGYWPRAIRYRSRQGQGGEVDLIVQKGSVLVAVEVKARPSLAAGHEAMNPREWRRRAHAVEDFLRRKRAKNLSVRFDLVVVCPYFQIQHIEAAWQPDFFS